MDLEQELAFARRVCAEAGGIQLAAQNSVLNIAIKTDHSPVTQIDQRCERHIIDAIRREYPGDSILGEESGASGDGPRRWIIDPLDGTRPYIHGIPTFSALLALERDGEPVVGVVHLAAMGISCWAHHGGGAFVNGSRVHVSRVDDIGAAMGSALGFVERDDTTGRALLKLMRRWDYAYGFMDAYTYVAVASGKLDACVNLLDKPWDCAAAACIVTEAGGKYSDIRGTPSVHNGSFVITNGILHRETIDLLRGD